MDKAAPLDRRSFVSGLTGTALAIAPITVASAGSASSTLQGLIDAHKVAHNVWRAAEIRLEELNARYDIARDYQSQFVAAEHATYVTNDADEEAFIAVCAYPCESLDEARIKAEYLASIPLDMMGNEHLEALVQSFLPRSL